MQDALLARNSGVRSKGDLTPPGMTCEFGQQPNSTERIERALGHAFDRLWCCDRNDRDMSCANADGGNGQTHDELLIGTIDCYIAQHFRRVAELSRESIYQGHQYQLWNRMKENVARCGDGHEDDGVADHLRELDDKINRAALDDQNVQQEINHLMRIVQGPAFATGACAAAGALAAGSCCSAPSSCDDNKSPPLFGAGSLERRRCDASSSCSVCAPRAACCSGGSSCLSKADSSKVSSDVSGIGAPLATGGAAKPIDSSNSTFVSTRHEGSGPRQVPKCTLCSTAESCSLQ